VKTGRELSSLSQLAVIHVTDAELLSDKQRSGVTMPDVVAKALKELESAADRTAAYGRGMPTRRRGSARPRTTGGLVKSARGAGRRRPASGARRGRKGEPTRSDEFLALVREKPGITVKEAAERTSVQPTSLYRVCSKLLTERSIVRTASGG
jgi:hypothetical protein